MSSYNITFLLSKICFRVFMYSESLAIADRNTVNLMIDELKDQINNLNDEIAEKEAIIQEKDAEIESLHRLFIKKRYNQ